MFSTDGGVSRGVFGSTSTPPSGPIDGSGIHRPNSATEFAGHDRAERIGDGDTEI